MSETTRQFLKKIEEVLISNPKGLTLNTISDIVGEDRDRVKMYLDFLEISEKIEIKLVGDFQLYVHLQHSVARYDATEYIETERKLQESEERIKLALRGAALGTWDWDAKSNLTTFNERYAEILGYTVDELDSTYEGWLQTLHPDDREQARKEWEDARDGEAVFYSSEHRMLTKSGGWRWVLSSGGGVEYDEEGHILRASGTIMDITDRKTIEQNLQMSENSYRVLFSESPISLWDEDYSAVKEYLDGLLNSGVKDLREYLTQNPEEVVKCANLVNIKRVNKATVELQGVADETYLLGSLGKIFNEDAIELFREEILALIMGNTSYKQELTLTTSSGEEKSLILQVSIPEENVATLDKVIVSMLDITDRKQAEELLKVSEERYRTIISSMHDIIFVHDRDDYFTGVYAADEKYLLRPASEFIGTHPSEVEHPELYELFSKFASKVRETGNSETYDYSLIINGKEEWYTAVLSLHEDGESIVAVARPVTERKIAEKLLRDSQQMLETVLNAMPQYVWWKDTDLRFLGCNENFAKLAGFESSEAIVGLGVEELGWSPENVKSAEELDRSIMETNRPRLNQISSSENEDGSMTWFEGDIMPLHDAIGNVIGILSMTEDITDRVKMDQALKDSEEKYRSLVNNIPLGIAIIGNTPPTVLFTNPAFEEILGYNQDEITSKNTDEVLQLIHPDDRDNVLNTLRGHREGLDIIVGNIVRGIHKNGNIHWVRLTSTLIQYEGEPASLFTFHDISDRVLSAQELSKSENRYRALFEDSPMSIFEEDWSKVKERIDELLADGVDNLEEYLLRNEDELLNCASFVEIIGANKGALELHHMTTKEELLGPLTNILTQDAYRIFLDELLALTGGRQFYETGPEYVTVMGRKRYLLFRLTVPPGHENKLDRVIVSMVDITDTKKTEHALMESLDQYQRTIYSITDAIHVVDRNMRMLLANPALERWLKELGLEEFQRGMNLYEIFPFLDKNTRNEYLQVFETGESLVTEGSTMLEGIKIFTEVTKIPIISEGEVTQVLTIIRDISVRKLAENALKESEARYRNIAEIATLYLDLMGHDLTNQLQVLSVGTEMLGLTKLPEECVSIVDNIKTSVEYSQDLIAKVKSTQGFLLEPLVDTSLTDTIISISNEFKRISENVELTLELGAAEAHVLADGYINVLLLNLLDNAVVHNPNRRKRVWVKLNPVVNGFEVRISDNGLGLSDEQKSEILDPSRRFGGIGVHQARNIINKYGGYLSVTDRVKDDPTKGAEFRIFFPMKELDV